MRVINREKGAAGVRGVPVAFSEMHRTRRGRRSGCRDLLLLGRGMEPKRLEEVTARYERGGAAGPPDGGVRGGCLPGLPPWGPICRGRALSTTTRPSLGIAARCLCHNLCPVALVQRNEKRQEEKKRKRLDTVEKERKKRRLQRAAQEEAGEGLRKHYAAKRKKVRKKVL